VSLVDQLKSDPSIGRIEYIGKSNDEIIQEKLMKILMEDEQASARKYSELSKIQAVKVGGNVKSYYMCYDNEQIALAESLKRMELN